jgi:nitrogen fixation/metabolism regulation signal transduction histidine kinase
MTGTPDSRPAVILADGDEAITSNLAAFLNPAGFTRAELRRARPRRLPGTGVGLALVRVIVARHQGQAAIRSRDGQGTVVSVRIPVAGRTETAPDVAGLRQRRDTPGKAAS